jgi:hypothetical protein
MEVLCLLGLHLDLQDTRICSTTRTHGVTYQMAELHRFRLDTAPVRRAVALACTVISVAQT